MAFGFAAVCYIIALILTAFLIFFVIFHVSITRKITPVHHLRLCGVSWHPRLCVHRPIDRLFRQIHWPQQWQYVTDGKSRLLTGLSTL